MDADDLRAFANRDWRAIALAKREYQVGVFREQGPAAMVRIAREVFAHARAVNPDWPSDREADLAHHVELKRAPSSARRS
jgi:hypothetical protein